MVPAAGAAQTLVAAAKQLGGTLQPQQVLLQLHVAAGSS